MTHNTMLNISEKMRKQVTVRTVRGRGSCIHCIIIPAPAILNFKWDD